MTQAFKCDVCGDFYEGYASERKLKKGSVIIASADCCESCAEWVDDEVTAILKGEYQ